jgi:DNA-binding MarR family transcriptional regulator
MVTTRAKAASAHDANTADGAEPMTMYLVKQLELAVRSHLDDLLRPAGLTTLQYTALTVLERHPDMSSAQLARNSFVTAQSMADIITALEGRGLIERHRDRADRRRLVVALSPGGRDLLDRYRDQVGALEAAMLAGLTKADVVRLRRGLHVCRANLAGHPPRLPARGHYLHAVTAVRPAPMGGRTPGWRRSQPGRGSGH